MGVTTHFECKHRILRAYNIAILVACYLTVMRLIMIHDVHAVMPTQAANCSHFGSYFNILDKLFLYRRKMGMKGLVGVLNHAKPINSS